MTSRSGPREVKKVMKQMIALWSMVMVYGLMVAGSGPGAKMLDCTASSAREAHYPKPLI